MKNKGFTLIEMLVSFLILAVIGGIGIVSYNYIIGRVENNYYKTLESELLLAGNEYFNNHRGDKPIEGYNKVDINTLIESNYIETLKDHDGNICQISENEESSVYIYSSNEGYKYEVCLICNGYQSSGNYCNGTNTDEIKIRATSNNMSYNPLLSYSNTAWATNDVIVTFSMNNTVSKYIVVDNQNKEEQVCNVIENNRCSMTISKTSNYIVTAYNNNQKVGNAKSFNIKVDKTYPSYEIDETNEFILELEETGHLYTNEVKNLYDDNGIKEVKYTLTGNGMNESNDITGTLKIGKQLVPG